MLRPYFGIAGARHGDDLRRRRQEIAALERTLSVAPINVTGRFDPLMRDQQAEMLAQRREELRHVEALSGDDVCRAYAADIIAQQEAPPVVELRNSDGSPLRRGGQPAVAAPGMF